jgi:DNA-binding LytR/AlgR family response regulator
LKIGLCDDDNIFLNYLEKQIRAYFGTSNDITVSSLRPLELSKQIADKSFPYDIFITDIDMGIFNGIEFAKQINRINSSCIIIFISNYLNFATEVYDAWHIYFVLKSDIEMRLTKALDKAMLTYSNQENKCIKLRYQNVDHIIPCKNITHIETLGRYLYLYDEKQSYKYIYSLKSISEELTASFIRCHNSYIINMNYIRSVSRTDCTLTTGFTIPISQTYLKGFQAAYLKYISDKLS